MQKVRYRKGVPTPSLLGDPRCLSRGCEIGNKQELMFERVDELGEGGAMLS